MMLSKEVLQKIKLLHIKTNHLANEIFSGEYKSSFRGQGIEFEEVMEYQAGDDIRSIDWNVTARTNKPHIKIFREERQLTMMLLVDASASGEYGTQNRLKKETFAEVAALLAFAAIKNNDKVGLMIFTDRVEKFIPPKKGKSHVYHVIKEILTFQPEYRQTNLNPPLETLLKVLTRRAICFVISDFQAADYEKALGMAGKRHDVICTLFYDMSELSLPPLGLVHLQDPETGFEIVVDTTQKKLRQKFLEFSQAQLKQKEKLFNRVGVDSVLINQNKDFIDPLLKFFRLREKRMY